MANWTDPASVTWAPDDIPTAAQMNAFLQQNPLFLYEAFSDEVVQTLTGNSDAYWLEPNFAHGSKLIVPRKFAVTAVRFRNTIQSGNIDVGIYTTAASPVRLWSRGSIACPSGASTVSISAGSPTTLTLTPGIYWFVLAADNATARWRGSYYPVNGTSIVQSSCFPLPNPISTPASNSSYLAPYGLLA